MAGIDADLMREARALFAKFHEADPKNARRKWQSIAADAPKANPWRPNGSANPHLDQVLLQVYDGVIAEDPLLQPEAVGRVADAVVKHGLKLFGRHYTYDAIKMRLTRLLNERGGVKRITPKQSRELRKKRAIVEILMNPTRYPIRPDPPDGQ
jgi:hypothetical protein